MASPLRAFLFALGEKFENKESEDEIKKAEQAGEMAARNAAKRIGIVEQVEVDAEKAREDAKAKVSQKSADGKNEERTN